MATDAELTTTFAEFDGNGDGQITSAEFGAAMVARGEEITEREITEIFADADTDRDGTISFTEFAVAWNRAGN
ncbi:MAG: EF-hand domain-containing protein [Actinophytocola sp.]|uniref:EF-hand domain-containing protein n=1 Tax=Actinophytocola sp. TaxID=1872138 RepID=UPI003C762C05